MAGNVGKKGYVSDINVTPFVDVMLVLLIIFMVTAPMLTEGLEVDLPQTKQVDILPTETEYLVLTIKSDGKLMLDTYEVPLEELEARVNALVTQRERELYLQADKSVPYGLVVDVMGRIRAAGIEKLGVVALKSEDK